MGSSAAVTSSLRDITKVKLDMLCKRQQLYAAFRNSLLNSVNDEESLPVKVRILLDAFAKHKIDVPKHISTANISQFLQQSYHDRAVTPNMLRSWQSELQQALDVPTRKYEHAVLYGKMVMEWLEDGESEARQDSAVASTQDADTSFERVGRQEMYEQRQEWEKLVFTASSHSNPDRIKAYLERVFIAEDDSKKVLSSPLDTLRDEVRRFKLGRLDLNSLKTVIKSLLKADALSRERITTLLELEANPATLREMVDALNMQIDALESWTWGADPIPVDMRRALNGKYRVFMDEEPLQAVLLHFIGIKWAVYLKRCFCKFMRTHVRERTRADQLDKTVRARHDRFFPEKGMGSSLTKMRYRTYQEEWLMQQLPSSLEEGIRDYGDTQSDDMTDEGDIGERKSPIALKQSLLHMISAENLVSTELHGSFTILQSDFRWFGPSLPHSTIGSVLSFLGVSHFWQEFFHKFLQTPIIFPQDGLNATARTRQNGVPISHLISDALGEAVLFCLDFAVNQATEANLYRFHDDLWFWGPDEKTLEAWRIIQDFAVVMGLHLNKEKTASARIIRSAGSFDTTQTGQALSGDLLPNGQIRWGFLILDTNGQWIIDDAQVDKHIAELRLQLSACKSVLGWVQAWNSYVSRFLSNNFGEPSNALGRHHVTMVIETFKKIQASLFSSSQATGGFSGNVSETVKSMIASRFESASLPDGLLYLPLENGGLGLRNPFIPLLLIHDIDVADQSNKTLREKTQESRWANPVERIQASRAEDERLYNQRVREYEENSYTKSRESYDEDFMSLEEFMAHREDTSMFLCSAYADLLRYPESKVIKLTPKRNDESLSVGWQSGRGQGSYEKWILELYGDEIVRDYGRLDFAEKKLLPLGLATMLRSQRIMWQG